MAASSSTSIVDSTATDNMTTTTTASRLSSLFVLLLFFLFAHTRSEIITLTSDTFSDKVKEKDMVWLVKFCVPWCKHCKNMGTLWEDLAKVVESEDVIGIGEVDCTIDKPLCTKVDIHSYPTFKVFYDGEEFSKYKGLREVESLKKFILDEAERAERSRVEDERDL